VILECPEQKIVRRSQVGRIRECGSASKPASRIAAIDNEDVWARLRNTNSSIYSSGIYYHWFALEYEILKISKDFQLFACEVLGHLDQQILKND
jgi:hypothetical protein